jgi:GT2 family glycosyltransferase
MTPLLSIVSATRNRPDSIRRLIASVRRQSIADRIEVIIVDDASDRPFSLEPEVKLIRNDTNIGPCAARNQGFRAAQGKFILLCDDDVEWPNVNTFQQAIDTAEKYPRFGAIGFKQFMSNGEPHHVQPVHSSVAVSATTFFGYCVLLRTEAVLGVGGFNESIRYCYEEQELGFRMHDAGWEIMFDPNLMVTHHHDPRGRNWHRIQRLITLNAIRTILMRFPLPYVLPCVLLKLLSFPVQSIRRGQNDWQGAFWLWGATLSWIIPALREREAIQISTLSRYRQLKRSPIPVC